MDGKILSILSLCITLGVTEAVAQEGNDKNIRNISLFSGIENYASPGSGPVVDLFGWSLQTEVWYGKADKTILNIEAALNRLDGRIEGIPTPEVGSNYGKMRVSLEQRISSKFAINPRYLYLSDIDCVREVTKERVSAHSPALYLVINPKKNLAFYPGFSISRYSNSKVDYYSFLDLMYYPREFDWFTVRGCVNTNTLYNSTSLTAGAAYNYQFSKFISDKLSLKLGATVTNDRYSSQQAHIRTNLWAELKYQLEHCALSANYGRTNTQYCNKDELGLRCSVSWGGK